VWLQHLLNYPLISDGITTFKSNEYAQRSIKLGDSAYQTFAAPVLPWIAKPYGYISPYVQRADSIGDKALDRVDERFPVVKKPTNELYNDTRSLILLPYNKSIEGRDHVFQVYSSEIKKAEQQHRRPGQGRRLHRPRRQQRDAELAQQPAHGQEGRGRQAGQREGPAVMET